MLAGSPEDIAGMKASRGIPAVRGGMLMQLRIGITESLTASFSTSELNNFPLLPIAPQAAIKESK